jgi:uncharacterized protein YdhG (YjbR/CyaY superfamily)
VVPTTIDEYIAAHPRAVRPILRRIRATIRKAAPGAAEAITYRIPTFVLNGPLVYFGAFKNHIGLYPPVRDAALRRESSVYAGEKGNLRFPLDAPVPYDLIARIVDVRVQENRKRMDAIARGAACRSCTIGRAPFSFRAWRTTTLCSRARSTPSRSAAMRRR